jgi:SAM-dependent methyltransferase
MSLHEASQPNPWLSIPWEDYEGHMSHPAVKQSPFLSEIFHDALHNYKPETVAILGCATGNGFEHIDPVVSKRVTAVDLNPEYLDIVQNRFGSKIPGLHCICQDVVKCELEARSYDLIHCALIFEYLDPSPLIEKISLWVRHKGILVVVLQLPSPKSGSVTRTEFKSLKRLEPIMKLIEPEYLKRQCFDAGFVEIRAYVETLVSGKAFFIGHYRKLDD